MFPKSFPCLTLTPLMCSLIVVNKYRKLPLPFSYLDPCLHVSSETNLDIKNKEIFFVKFPLYFCYKRVRPIIHIFT